MWGRGEVRIVSRISRYVIELGADERAELERRAREVTAPWREVQRARSIEFFCKRDRFFQLVDRDLVVAVALVDVGKEAEGYRQHERTVGAAEPVGEVTLDVDVTGDVAAMAAKPLGERALDDVDLAGHTIPLGHAARSSGSPPYSCE